MVWLKQHACWGPTGVGYDEVSSLVVEGAVGGARWVPRARQALVSKVHGVAVIQQRLSDLKPGLKTVSTVTLKPPYLLVIFLKSWPEKRMSLGFRRLLHKHVVHLCSSESWKNTYAHTDLVWANVLCGLKDSMADLESLFYSKPS